MLPTEGKLRKFMENIIINVRNKTYHEVRRCPEKADGRKNDSKVHLNSEYRNYYNYLPLR